MSEYSVVNGLLYNKHRVVVSNYRDLCRSLVQVVWGDFFVDLSTAVNPLRRRYQYTHDLEGMQATEENEPQHKRSVHQPGRRGSNVFALNEPLEHNGRTGGGICTVRWVHSARITRL